MQWAEPDGSTAVDLLVCSKSTETTDDTERDVAREICGSLLCEGHVVGT
jgi:hypothetical protein